MREVASGGSAPRERVGGGRRKWHLRNYLLMLGGLRPLVELRDEPAYLDAWRAASPHDHEALDEAVIRELAVQDR